MVWLQDPLILTTRLNCPDEEVEPRLGGREKKRCSNGKILVSHCADAGCCLPEHPHLRRSLLPSHEVLLGTTRGPRSSELLVGLGHPLIPNSQQCPAPPGELLRTRSTASSAGWNENTPWREAQARRKPKLIGPWEQDSFREKLQAISGIENKEKEENLIRIR